MKVGFINNTRVATGLGRYSKELIDNIRKETDVLDDVFLNFQDGTIDINGEASITVRRTRRFPLEYRYFFYYRSTRKMPAYTIYHISNQNLSFLELKPKIVTCFDILHRIIPANIGYRGFALLAYSGLKSADMIIAGSQNTKNDLVHYYGIDPERIRVIYCGISEEFRVLDDPLRLQSVREKYDLPEGLRYIFHISNEQPHKNFDILLVSFNRLIREYRVNDVILVKAGRAQYRRDAIRHRKIIADSGLEDRVRLLGYVPDEDLAALYNLSTLFVFPSSYEGFGLPVLEAMACGTPVITSNVSSLPEIAGNACLTVDINDAGELADSMHELLTQEAKREEFARKGLQRAKAFDWKDTARRTLQLYQELAGSFQPGH